MELKRFGGDFRSKDNGQHYPAWIELLVHQIFVQIWLEVSMPPDLPGTTHTPDFEARGRTVPACLPKQRSSPRTKTRAHRRATRKTPRTNSRPWRLPNKRSRTEPMLGPVVLPR